MNTDLVRIAVIGAVALALYYIVTNNMAIPNHGEVNPEVDLPEGYATQAPTQVKGALPNYTPSSQQQPMSSNFAKAQQPAYGLDPTQEPTKTGQLNIVKKNENVLPYPQISNNYGPQQANVTGAFGIKTGTQPSLDCYPKDTVSPQDLMPNEDPNNTWSQSNPNVSGHLADRNFLESAHLYGIDTVSSSMKNANLQLRSDPVIAQIQVGPWSQSTITADTSHRMLDIGGDY